MSSLTGDPTDAIISPDGDIPFLRSGPEKKEKKNIEIKNKTLMPNHCSTSQTSLHCLLGNQHRESVKKSCEGMWLDDAVQFWTTGVNVGSQVKKKKKREREGRRKQEHNDVMFTLLSNSLPFLQRSDT